MKTTGFKISNNTDLTKGPIGKSILLYCIPIFLGQLLQQFYTLCDAWVIGQYAGNEAFAAVSSSGSITFFVIGFFNGISVGGGVIISRFYGAKDEENVSRAIHTNILFGIIASVFATVVGVAIVPWLLKTMDTPEEVLPYSLTYLTILFAGVSATIMYNICMSVQRAVGDSVSPLVYLFISSVLNVVLDLLLVGVFNTGVAGAAIATIAAQFISTVLCIMKMRRATGFTRLEWSKIRWHGDIMKEVILQGIPNGVQNSVISIGNMTVQANINAFGAAAMSGVGAYFRAESFVFLPIGCLSMAIPTYISQNLGAREYGRAKKGAAISIITGMVLAETVGFLLYAFAEPVIRIFIDDAASIEFGMRHAHVTTLFYFLLAFSHCAAGVMRGAGKSIVPMVTMLAFWCGVRVTYVTIAVKFIPELTTVSFAYPITWTLSSIVFIMFLIFDDWPHYFEKREKLDKK